MFVVLSWLKGPISPTYRDQTQLVGVAFMQLMAALCACPISVPCSATSCPVLIALLLNQTTLLLGD